MKRSQITRSLTALLLILMLALTPVIVIASPAEALTIEQLMEDPSKNITRGEFAMLINACLSLPEMEGAGFSDVPEGHPYAADIMTAQAIGYMNGYGQGIFRPDATISGAEAAVSINYFLGFDLTKVQPNDLTTVPAWANPAVSNLLDLRMIALELADKRVLSVADAVTFATALLTAMMFQGSPYALAQVSERDDFYGYNNRQYLATATIQPGYFFAMAFLDPEFEVQNRLTALLTEILTTESAPGSDQWKIKQLFEMYMDEPGRAASLESIMPIVDEINAVSSIAELNELAAKYYSVMNLQGFYAMAVASDARVDATQWCAIIVPGSFMLGTRDYYTDDESLAPVHDALKNYLAAMLGYAGETDDLEARAAAMFEMEQANALASMPMELFNDPEVIYAKSSWAEMDGVTAGSNSLNYSPELREVLSDANVYCPDMDYIKHIESLYTEDNLAVLKDFAILNLIGTFGGFVGDDFADLNVELQVVLFGGAVERMSLELRAQSLVTSLMSNAFSKLYAEQYVTSAVRDDVTQIVESIRDKYRERIAALEWMSDETKAMAIEKLDAIKTYIAYPDDYGSAYDFDVRAYDDGGNLIEFYMDYCNAVYGQQLDLLSRPYDGNLWDNVPTYTVNAFYSPTENAIIIPAGILQEPFYSGDAQREANLGGIGAVIAHEISHAFDNSGAQYDKNGTLSNWWAESDFAAFMELAGGVADALSDILFVGDMSVNGVLCTGEAIADLGAMTCVLDIAGDIDDADLALVMRSWANIWASRMSAEVAAYMLSIDVHPPHKVRANFILSQLEEFYETFGITEADAMFVAPDARLAIW